MDERDTGKKNSSGAWKVVVLMCATAIATMTGCHHADLGSSAPDTLLSSAHETKAIGLSKSDCFLCGDREDTLLPFYFGQENIGIIDLHTFEFIPVEIQPYDDTGNSKDPIPEYGTSHSLSTGEDGFFCSVLENPSRGYATVYLAFPEDPYLDLEYLPSFLCSDCMDRITNVTDGLTRMAIIDFSSKELRPLGQTTGSFLWGDYYIDCDKREHPGDSDRIEMDMLIFYCPEKTGK